MTTWRGHSCMAGLCRKPASLDIRLVPLCVEHGWEVAQAYKERILLEDRIMRSASTELRVEATQERRGNRTGEVVYYVRIGAYVKIGYSARLRNRLASLRADELLACEPGGPELERQRHEEFADDRINPRRENFRPSDRLEAHISAVRSEHGLPHWATTPDTTTVTVRRIGDPK